MAKQRPERIGLHLRLRSAAEHDRRRATVRPIPGQHLPAVFGQCLRHLREPADLLGEAATRRQHPGLALAHQLIGDVDTVQLRHGHARLPLCEVGCITLDERHHRPRQDDYR